MKYLILLFTISLVLFSCKTNKQVNTEVEQEKVQQEQKSESILSLKGQLRRQGMTTYQYGSHLLKTEKKTYALRSKTIDLDKYIDKTIRITGEKIEGYPVSGGPVFINVLTVEE